MTHRLFKSNPAEARWPYCIGYSVVCTPTPNPRPAPPLSYLVENPPIKFRWLDRISILRGGELFVGESQLLHKS